MKWILASERLPKETNHNMIFKTNEFVSTGSFIMDSIVIEGTVILPDEIKKIRIWWLDESEEEITDTMRLNWLEDKGIQVHLTEDDLERDLLSLREFIDKQLKHE